MEMKDVLKKLREKNSLTQEQMAKRVMVTRQAVSRWETGETQPNTDTLKLLSQEFEVSVNTLLALLVSSFVNAVELPLNEDAFISREKMEATTKIIVSGVMQRGSLYISQESLYWIILWNICRILIIWEWMTGELNLTYIFHS